MKVDMQLNKENEPNNMLSLVNKLYLLAWLVAVLLKVAYIQMKIMFNLFSDHIMKAQGSSIFFL